MFSKYASTLLQDLSNECMLKSFASTDEDESKMYRSIAGRADWLLKKLSVESVDSPAVKGHD